MILDPRTEGWLGQVVFSPDGQFAATKSLKHEVFVWGMDEPDRPVRWARRDYATGLAFTKAVRTFFPDDPATGLRGSAGWRSRRTAVGWSRATWP